MPDRQYVYLAAVGLSVKAGWGTMVNRSMYRMTRQRKLILEELRAARGHLSADELYERVRRKLPRISLGTVYRNLEVLHEQGEIQKHEFGGTQKRFDGNPDMHYHIRCICCDRVDDAPIALVPDIEKKLNGCTDYKIVSHRLEFVGLCPECSDHMVAPGLTKLHGHILDD